MKEITAADYDARIRNQSADQIIDEYYELKGRNPRRRVRFVLDALGQCKGRTVLDLGCGVGTFAFHASKAGAACWGIDYSFESVKLAQALCRRYRIPARFMVSDACYLPFSDSRFDAIVAADFIEHVTREDKDRILKEIKRVLKPRGTVVFFTPNGIREKIGEAYWKMRRFLFGDSVPGTDLHFGLTTRSEFESLLKNNGFRFRLYYRDVTRPYLARIPGIRACLALNLLWTAVIDDRAKRY